MHLFKKNAFPSQTTNATCYKSTYFKDKYHMWGPVGPQRASGIKVYASGEPHINKSHKIIFFVEFDLLWGGGLCKNFVFKIFL